MNFPNEPCCVPTIMRIATDGQMRDLGRRLAVLLRAGVVRSEGMADSISEV